MIPRELDLDWLETAVDLIMSGKHRYRQQGKTTAYLALMIGEVELGGPSNTYLYIGESAVHTEEVCAAFYKLITQRYGEYVVTNRTHAQVFIGDQQFYFAAVRQLMFDPNRTRRRGIDRIFFDVDDSSQKRLDSDGKLSALFQQLIPALSYRRGDVI